MNLNFSSIVLIVSYEYFINNNSDHDAMENYLVYVCLPHINAIGIYRKCAELWTHMEVYRISGHVYYEL